MKTKGILILLSFLITTQFYGQTFEEYKKQQESDFAAFKQKQQEFIDQMQNEFDDYVKQRDKEFADYLSTEWSSHKVKKGEAPPSIPKPPDRPIYAPEPAEEVIPEKEVEKRVVETKPKLVKQLKNPLMVIEDGVMRPLIPPKIKKSSETKGGNSNIEIIYYGNPLSFDFSDQVIISPPVQINESTISKYWFGFSESDFVSLLNQFQNYRNIMNLNDWAYYLLVKAFSDKVYPDSETGSELMAWTLLTQSGYKARIGYANNKLSVLLPTYNTLYTRKYLKSDGISFYVMNDLGTDNILTYNQDHPDAIGVMDFNIYRPLNFSEDLGEKTFSFNYLQNQYSLKLDFNKNVIDFYSDFPQVDIDVYFNAAVSNASKESILNELSESISGMSDQETVGFLLHFVQTAFNYQVDDDQFGKEKFLFAEETVFYPASDCEDRSVLFAYLVKELLNYKVIGLEYPGHVSTAVKIPGDVAGDRVIFQNEAYIVADATYENAPLGLTMPEHRNKEPEVILLNNFNYYENKNLNYWELVNKSGGFRGDQLTDLLFDDDNNAYLTGYYIDKVTFGDYTLETGTELKNRGAFIVKYNSAKEVEWAKRINSSQNATAYAITQDDAGNLYISGSFKGEIDAGGDHPVLTCMENLSDVFLAKYNREGQLIWVKKAGLDTYPQGNYFTYNIKFSDDGISMGTAFYSENEYSSAYGLSIDQTGVLNVTGSFMNSTGFDMNMLVYEPAEGELLNIPKSLKLENDRLLKNDCNQAIAGVFSVLHHIKLSGFRMLGTDAQKTLDEYNPGFQEEYPDIYKSLGKINFVFNDDGIVSVETLNGKTVQIREMKIKDGAKMKVVPFEDGNVKVDIFNGVQVGKFFIWFNLNYIKMFQKNGNLLFDYDKDHSQITMNMKKHILR